MPLINADRILVAKAWRDMVHGELGQSASWDVADILAAVVSIDDTMDLNVSALTQNQTVLQNLNNRLPEPIKSGATTPQKWILLAHYALKKAGVI